MCLRQARWWMRFCTFLRSAALDRPAQRSSGPLTVSGCGIYCGTIGAAHVASVISGRYDFSFTFVKEIQYAVCLWPRCGPGRAAYALILSPLNETEPLAEVSAEMQYRSWRPRVKHCFPNFHMQGPFPNIFDHGKIRGLGTRFSPPLVPG